MDISEVLQELEAQGTAQNRKTYTRHGGREPMYGVSFAVLGVLQKKIKKNHALALQLWESGNYDAQILACQVADASALTESQAEAWVAQVYNYVQSDQLAELICHSPMALEKAKAWIQADGEYRERVGWLVLARLAESDQMDDAFCLALLKTIEQNIHQAKNRVRDAMNTTLICLGLRPALLEPSLAAAARIGKVLVDHGETGCKTPDATAYIHKTLERRMKKKK